MAPSMRALLGSFRRWAYILPIISVMSWLGMLATLFIFWCTSGQPRYISEIASQNIAFVSDIGAQTLKPLFIACTSLSTCTYIPSVTLYFYYHTSANASAIGSFSSRTTKYIIPGMSIALSTVGGLCLVLLTIFDTARYSVAHKSLLPTSIIAHILGAGVLCLWTALRLRNCRNGNSCVSEADKFTVELYPPLLAGEAVPRISTASLVTKSVIGVCELCMVMLFAITTWSLKTFDTAAVMEWTVVLLFGGYMSCLGVDLWIVAREPKRQDEGFGMVM